MFYILSGIISSDQAEQSQATEDGFQRIREVTGLTDVMDIVHKRLDRDLCFLIS